MATGMIPRIPKNPAATQAPPAATSTPAATSAPAAAGTTTNEPGPAAAAAGPAVAAAGTAVVAAASNAVSTRVAGKPVDVLERDFKNTLKVDWNTLHRIMVTQGNFVDKENGNAVIGPDMVLDLMSYQDSWQISPGVQGEEAAEHVRYSDDGLLTTQGEPCQEYLAALKEAGYNEAKMTKRVVLAGTIQSCAKPDLIGKMIQMDLSQTSKNLFDRHRFQIALDIAKGLRKADSGVNLLKMGCQVQSAKGNTWTMATFNYAN